MEKKEDKEKQPSIKVSVVEETSVQPAEVDQEAAAETPNSAGTTEDVIAEASPELTKAVTDKPSKLGIFVSFFFGLSFGALLFGGFFYYKASLEGNSSPAPGAEVQQTQEEINTTQEEVVEEKEEEKIDLTKYSVNILNGSGIAGEAGRVEKILTDAGFKNTKAGNASTYNHTITDVAIKAGLPEALFKELEAIMKDYKLVEKEPLETASAYDIVITVGSSKNTSEE